MESAGGRKVFHSDKKDMLMHACIYDASDKPLSSAAGSCTAEYGYICVFGFASFIENAFWRIHRPDIDGTLCSLQSDKEVRDLL